MDCKLKRHCKASACWPQYCFLWEAMTKTMLYMIPVLLLPRWLMYTSPLRKAAVVHAEFEQYVREMIREEKRKIGEGEQHYKSASASGNLVTSVLQASADYAIAVGKSCDSTNRKQAFTEDEVIGKLVPPTPCRLRDNGQLDHVRSHLPGSVLRRSIQGDSRGWTRSPRKPPGKAVPNSHMPRISKSWNTPADS